MNISKILLISLLAVSCSQADSGLPVATAVPYNNELEVELAVGLWGYPIPWDVDGDGLKDIVVNCADVPYKGTYFFRNIGTSVSPLFDKAVKLGDKSTNDLRFSEWDGKPYLTTPGVEQIDFFKAPFAEGRELGFDKSEIESEFERSRSNMWNRVDWDGDGDVDIVIGIDSWDDYGWDNAFDSEGEWTRGPLHGYVYFVENDNGKFVNRGRLSAGGETIDTFGAPCPCIADFDGDGDLDMICGEFLDGLTWFENVGTRTEPHFASGRRLANADGEIRFHIQMIVPVASDFDGDGKTDLVVGDEDGTVSFVRNTGEVLNHMPVFESRKYLMQKADLLKFGALATPCSYDWDGDGLEDLICGNSSGNIALIRNRGFNPEPVWSKPELFRVDGCPIRVQAGQNGSIQGPAEKKWGYTVPFVADWDGDGLADIIINSIWGKIQWFRNLGGQDNLEMAAAQPIPVDRGSSAIKPEWNWWNPEGEELVSQWRTTPVAIDWNRDSLMDLVMLDCEGYLAYYERYRRPDGTLALREGRRVFTCTNGSTYQNRKGMIDEAPGILRLNDQIAGASGRRKLCFTDWDNDGMLDLIVDGTNAVWFRTLSVDAEGNTRLEYKGDLSTTRLEGHTTCPTPVDWDKDGVPDLLLGAEDGHFYLIKNPLGK